PAEAGSSYRHDAKSLHTPRRVFAQGTAPAPLAKNRPAIYSPVSWWKGRAAVTLSREFAASVASLVAAGLFALAPHNVAAQAVAVASGTKGKLHLLPATLETRHWGWLNNAQPPVLRIDSGDTVVLETMMHSHNQVVPGRTIEEIKKIRTDFPGRGPHTLTGPIFVNGAEPGDVLKVHINKIVPRAYA